MNTVAQPPVIGFAAQSGVGKTTLLTRVLPLLRARGFRIGMIKRAHHDFDIDKPGKDSYQLRKAGAEQMLIASDHRWALMVENEPPVEPRLETLLARLDTASLHLVLVEGLKGEAFPKIEVYRAAAGKDRLYPRDDTIIAVATDTALDTDLPQLDINNPEQVADFIMDYFLT